MFNAPLTYPTLAERIIEALNHYRQTSCWWVYAYCVMPDHVHVLATPRDGHNLSDTLGALESYVVTRLLQHFNN
jgi:REP element-mobilizing transposase RayT